jgi:hypothetical protein
MPWKKTNTKTLAAIRAKVTTGVERRSRLSSARGSTTWVSFGAVGKKARPDLLGSYSQDRWGNRQGIVEDACKGARNGPSGGGDVDSLPPACWNLG